MQKLLLVAGLALLLGSVFLLNQPTEVNNSRYAAWKGKFGLEYTPSEDAYRFAIYEQNLAKIKAHNADTTQTYFLAETPFMTLTQEEFAAIYLTARRPEGMAYREYVPSNTSLGNLKGVDWRGVTRVKDQGQCGSCWAFSAVGAVEALYKIKRGQAVDLSEQQLVDCESHSYGCNGGYNNYALEFVQNNGLVSQGEYPYTARTEACRTAGGPNRIGGVQWVGNENLRGAINEYPVSVLVDASNWGLYGGGVFSNCGQSINHAVLAVGYQDDGAWIIKNSWGQGWGEAGHIRLAGGNTCGVQGYAYRALN